MPALLTSTETGPKAVSAGRHSRCPVRLARDVEAREGWRGRRVDRPGSVPLLDDVRDHDIRALGDEAARVAGAHSTAAPVTITVRFSKRFITPFAQFARWTDRRDCRVGASPVGGVVAIRTRSRSERKDFGLRRYHVFP